MCQGEVRGQFVNGGALSTIWDPRIEPRSSDLAASTFSCWAPHWPDYFFLCDWAAMHLAAVLADDRLIWMTNIFQILWTLSFPLAKFKTNFSLLVDPVWSFLGFHEQSGALLSSSNFYFLSLVNKIMPEEVILLESIFWQWKKKTSWRPVDRSLTVDGLFVSLYSLSMGRFFVLHPFMLGCHVTCTGQWNDNRHNLTWTEAWNPGLKRCQVLVCLNVSIVVATGLNRAELDQYLEPNLTLRHTMKK